MPSNHTNSMKIRLHWVIAGLYHTWNGCGKVNYWILSWSRGHWPAGPWEWKTLRKHMEEISPTGPFISADIPADMNHFKAFKDAEFVPSSTPVETDQFPPQVSFPESKGFIVFQHYTRHFLKKTNQSTFLISSFSLTHLDASASVLQVPSGWAVCSRTAWSRSWGPTSIFTAHCFKWLILLFGVRNGFPQIGHSGIWGTEGLSAFSASSRHLEEESKHRRTALPGDVDQSKHGSTSIWTCCGPNLVPQSRSLHTDCSQPSDMELGYLLAKVAEESKDWWNRVTI